MEFQNFLVEKNIQRYEDVYQVLTSDPYFLRIKVDEENYPTLYCVSHSDTTPKGEKWVMECNGLVVEKETNKIVCYTMDKMIDDSEDNKMIEEMDMETVHMELSVEGALIRVYWYNDEWMVSTKRCINAKKAYWLSKKNFYTLFVEAFGESGFMRLDKNECYSFILCHPENSIVVQYTTPKLYHLNTRSLETFEEIEKDVGVDKIPRREYNEEYLRNLETMTDLNIEGYVVVDGKKHRQKFISKAFKKAHELWGNNNNRFYRYFELRKQGPTMINEYLTYFPQDRYTFMQYEKKISDFRDYVYDIYMSRHVNKTIITVPQFLKKLIFELHGEFLKSRIMTDRLKINYWLLGLDVKLLFHLYFKYEEELKLKENNVQEEEEKKEEDVVVQA